MFNIFHFSLIIWETRSFEMAFSLLDKFLLTLGFSNDQKNIKIMKWWRHFIAVSVFFDIIPQVNFVFNHYIKNFSFTSKQFSYVVNEYLKGVNFVKFSDEMSYAWFNATTFLKLLAFLLNFDKIASIMTKIKNSLKDSDRIAVQQHENLFKKVVIVSACIVISEVVSEVLSEITTNGQHQALAKNLYFFDDTINVFVYVFFRILAIWSAFSHEYVIILIFFTYFVICMHLKTLYMQLHQKLQRLNDVNFEQSKEANEILKDCVENHRKILEIRLQIQESFSSILTNSLITNVVAMSLTLLVVATSGSVLFFINMGPAVMFNLFMLCYPSWVASNEVKLN